MNLYLTQDRIGTRSGGGAVTYHEYTAMASLGEETHPLDRARVPIQPASPFEDDELFCSALHDLKPHLAHLYAGCFSRTVEALKAAGAKVTYTAAAHDISDSRRAFEDLGLQFNLSHLTDPQLWARYVAGYLAADLVICPSTLSKRAMELYGAKQVVVIPHGCEIPKEIGPFPSKFTLGYLGQAGPDKGLRYLFEAWKKLDLKDGLLLIAGRNIEQALPLWRRFGGGNVRFMGFVDDIADFYNRITVYVQPSVTEGFGIEVLEAMAHGRPVVCSTGAGAADVVHAGAGRVVPLRDPANIVAALEQYIEVPGKARSDGQQARENAKGYEWSLIRQKYADTWRAMG